MAEFSTQEKSLFRSKNTMPPGPTSPEINNLIVDVGAYLFLAPFLHVILFAIVYISLLLLTKALPSIFHFNPIALAAKFAFVLFLAGLAGHIFWSKYIWNQVYYSPDYMVDFWMMFPAGEHSMHPAGWPPGHMIGSSKVSEILINWTRISSVCWITSAILIFIPIPTRANKRMQATG